MSSSLDSDKPLIFIVDELDRCRPNYAVEVLEQIKHFFSVKGIVFVLSIDKNHLESSVKGFYGSEQIDSKEYLRRFIDLEYSLPKPSTGNFIRYLYDYYSFKEFFSSSERIKRHELHSDPEGFLEMAKIILTNSKATLRQQEKIFGLARLALTSFKENEYVFPGVFFLLAYLRVLKQELYQKIENNDLSVQELSDATSDLLKSKNIARDGLNIVYSQAMLLWFYNNNKSQSSYKDLIGTNMQGVATTSIVSKLLSEDQSLAEYFIDISKLRTGRIELNYILGIITTRFLRHGEIEKVAP